MTTTDTRTPPYPNGGLRDDTWYRNSLARIYYITIRDTLIAEYKKINGEFKWNAENWLKFVNSPEIERVVHEKVATLSEFTRTKIAYCDQIGEFDEAIFPGFVSVFCIPLSVHPRSELVQKLEGLSQGPVVDGFGPVGIGQYATRQLTKAMMLLFLKDALGLDFEVSGGSFGHSGAWRINDELEFSRA